MNKKGDIFMPTFAIITLIILSYALFALVIKAGEDKTTFIGQSQAELLKTYQKAEQDLFYLENLVKYKTHETINEFSKNGGLKQECNARWKFNSNCEPDFENNFIELFKNKFENSGYDIKEIKIQDNNLILKFNLDYSKKFKNFNIDYNLQPEFKQEIALDFTKLNDLKNEIIKCINAQKDLTTCTNEKTSVSGDIIFYTIENNKNILILTDKLEFKKIDFKFEIDQKDTGVTIQVF
ncbi:MAG: hypothetical protein AABX55_02355 [Nanoarchaeota archaeon]